MGAVAPAAGLDDQLIARICEQLQLVVEQRRVQARESVLVTEPDPGDDERIALVGLAALAASATPVAGQRRGHVDELFTLRQ